MVAILIVLVAIWIGFRWTKGKSDQHKWLVWGLLLILGIGPCFSWLIGIFGGAMLRDGFAGIGIMIFSYGGIFSIGLVLIVVGIVKYSKNGRSFR